MDQITQSNAAGSEELAASSQELNSQSLAMNGLMGDLVGVVSGEAEKAERLRRHNTMVSDRKTQRMKRISSAKNLTAKHTSSASQTLIPFDDDKDFRNY
jgi:methyl-accepting chemotaxis protein